MLVGPDQITIRLETGQFACPGTSGDHNCGCSQFFDAFVGGDFHLAFASQGRLAHDRGHFVFLEEMSDPARELLRNPA